MCFTDDEAMTEAFTRKLLAAMPVAPSRLRVVSPHEHGMARVGHVAAFRPDAEASLRPLVERSIVRPDG